MAGRSRNWDVIAQHMHPPMQPMDVRTRLNAIVMRRNRIVHEGDYERLDRPRSPRRNGMAYTKAKRDIDFLADMINAIHAVV